VNMNMIDKRLPLALASALLLSSPSILHAQSMSFGGSPGSFTNFNFPIISPSFSRHVLNIARNDKVSATPPSNAPVDLSVGSDAALSARARASFMADINRGANNALVRGIADSFNHRNVRSQFGEAIAPYGLRETDLADICAAYYVAMWMIANQSVLPNRAQVQAVSRQIHGLLIEQGAHVDVVQRQLGAEEIMYKTVWAIDLRQQTQASGDEQIRQQFADVVWNMFKQQQDLDLRALLLTDKGFMPKK